MQSLDGTYAKYIDEFNVEIAPTNYENISNFNLNPELMIQYGFYPITIVNPEEVLKWPIIQYKEDKVNKRIFGTRINKEPDLETYKSIVLEKEKIAYEEILSIQVIYVNDISYNRNLYTISELSAMILTEDSYDFIAEDGSINTLNTAQITKFLKDKLYIENKYKQTHQKLIEQIQRCTNNKELAELEDVGIYSYPIIYYKITELHDNIRQEEILNRASGELKTVLNVGAFFAEETRVYYGEMGFNGKDYLDEHHIPYIHLTYPMGSIAGSPGDLNLDINFCTHNEQPESVIMLCKAMRNLGLNAIIDGNDILIDNKKCCGCTTLHGYINKQYTTSYIHISFTVNEELIDIVRVKPKVKDVIGLKDVIPEITREVLLKELENQFIEHGYRSTR